MLDQPPYVPDVYPDVSKRKQRAALDDAELPGMARFKHPVELEYHEWNTAPKE